MESTRTALVLGATGGLGGELARQLRGAGWQVRALNRSAQRVAERPDDLQWMQGDAMNRGQVVEAAQGAQIIVHAVNPPGYRHWHRLAPPMLENSIAAAKASGARIVLPGNVYNYGADAFPVLGEESPQHPATRKGAIRVEMERRLEAAAREGVRSLVVRSGDYFGPRASSNWFSQVLVKPGRAVKIVTNPGKPGIGHQWGYLPDVAQTMLRLIERDTALEPFARFHMQGHWDDDGTRMIDAITRVAARAQGGAAPRRRAFPWWTVRLASPLVPLFRELLEMRYLWEQPIRMDNRRLVGMLGEEPHTPLDEAVRATLVGLGCIADESEQD